MTFDPAILVRLGMGALATAALGRAAWTSSRVLSHFRASRSTEGQLLLERQAELSFALARVGAALAVLSALGSGLTVGVLAPSIRGAMCGFGVVHSTSTGTLAMLVSAGSGLASLVALEVLSLDHAARGLAIVRVAAVAVLGAFAASLLDLLTMARFFAELDFTVVASCCSTSVDAGARGAGAARAAGDGGAFAALLGASGIGAAAALSRRTALAHVGLVAGAVAVTLSAVAVPGYVAPHLFETPTHECVYCLLGRAGWYLGLGLFASLGVGFAAAVGRSVATLFRRAEPTLLEEYGRPAGRRAAVGLAVAALLCAAPVVRYRWLAGASLFP